MWPILAQFGNYELGTYGVLVAAAMLLGLAVARHLGKRDSLPPRAVNDIGLGILVAGLIGAASLGALVSLVRGVPISPADFRSAGAIHGGLLGAIPAAYLLARHFGLPFWLLVDAYIPATALGQAIGRLGCFAAGCCFGTPTSAPWAVTFTEPRASELGGVPLHTLLHPVQLYDALAHIALFLVLLVLHKRGLLVGKLIGIWCILEGAIRIAIEVFRGDLGRGVWLDVSWLSTGRLTSLVLFGLGVLFLTQSRSIQEGGSSTHPG